MTYSFEEVKFVLEESAPLYGTKTLPLKFLVDAQLPQRLSEFLIAKGFDSIHTLDLPDKNATTDKYVKEKACDENRVLITKDDDFLQSFLIQKRPPRLILIKTGNINNRALLEIFHAGIDVIATLIQAHPLLEITKEELIVHD